MIRLQQIKMTLDHTVEDIKHKILKLLKIKDKNLLHYTIVKKSIDARNKNAIKIIYTIDVELDNEARVSAYSDNKNIFLATKKDYHLPSRQKSKLPFRPCVVGAGPAGLFCALILAEQGYQPIVLERGKQVDERLKDVTSFWETGNLNTESNVQFGEGGAGTFSDGKLNTMVKDKAARNRKVLKTFVEAGAPSEILYLNKPHIGTDYLRTVVKNVRKKIIDLGGEILFEHKVTNLILDQNKIIGLRINEDLTIQAHHVVLALGHSARDTFEMLHNLEVPMEPKAFAIGVRIEHPQDMLNYAQFGSAYKHPSLSAADYKLTHRSTSGRGVYTFCMCPGGVVVNASSEHHQLVTNGMSYYSRDKVNSNSAVLVNVLPEDFGSRHKLAGVHFQRKWEALAFQAGGSNYHMPVQLVADFINNQESHTLGDIQPSVGNRIALANLNKCLPNYVADALKEGLIAFDKKIKGFARKDAILTGVETRSSSPVRITRNETYQSEVQGLYPCGEGAGYAGGIMSAAMDGIKVAEAIILGF